MLGGCDEIVVVVGAQAAAVARLLPDGVPAVTNPAHADGMGSSLRVGLEALADSDAQAALVMLVDLPDVSRAVADRLAMEFRHSLAPAGILARAGYLANRVILSSSADTILPGSSTGRPEIPVRARTWPRTMCN